MSVKTIVYGCHIEKDRLSALFQLMLSIITINKYTKDINYIVYTNNKLIIEKYLSKYDLHFNIEYIIPDISSLPKEFNNEKIFTIGCWYRFLAFEDFDRFLYLDCDTLCLKDLTPLFEDFDKYDNCLIGYHDTAYSCYYYSEKEIDSYFKGDYSRYINSGVMFCALKKVYPYDLDLIKKCFLPDQDYINFVYKDNIYIYSNIRNFIVHFAGPKKLMKEEEFLFLKKFLLFNSHNYDHIEKIYRGEDDERNIWSLPKR